ncbi:MAG: type I-C CRISPR-associated protein Cas8c/Csd1 [Deltaproteobacteria bacterium]|nr:type I-C CRISPR-associated protein Cas8c/Csd1 [Deltaproteobacteria bacterium]
MILQALASYYQRIADDPASGVALEGFEKKDIPFIIVLSREGIFKGLQDTREGEGKKKRARAFVVPKGVKKSSNIAANLLWDSPAYVLGRPKPDKKKDKEELLRRSKDQKQCFVDKIRATFPEPAGDAGVVAVLKFLQSGDFNPVFSHPLWPEIEESGGNISFQLEGDTGLVCQREAVIKAIMKMGSDEKGEPQTCLVSGEMDEPVRLHTAIKGVWNTQSSGANIVSFNLPAFNSYGKEQGYNAPVGKSAEFAYTTALNTLLSRDSRQRIQVGDASTVFWAEKEKGHEFEGIFGGFFAEPPKGESEQDNAALRALFNAPITGSRPQDEVDRIRFYVLGLAPNAARIAVRFWYAGTIGEIKEHIRQHFEDCSIVHGPKEREHLSLFRLLVSTALQGKSDNIQPNLAGEMMKAILDGTPYPQVLLSSVIRRIRSEHEVTYQRASVIKGVLARDSRFYKKSEMEVSMALDRSNINAGYLLGRLFAVLERAQEAASPGINATIRDRFYGAASCTPVAVFSHLLKLKNHHIAKLENRGQAINLEKQIGEIMAGLNDFPAHLNLQDQGRFAVGYYHQRQDFFTKKETIEGK